MGQSNNAEEVLVLDHGRRVDRVKRIVFTGRSFPDMHQDAAGVINYRGAVAVVRRDPQGLLFVDLAEPLVRGSGRSLTRRLILN